MDFTQMMVLLDVMFIVVIILGVVMGVLGGTVAKTKVGYIGVLVFAVGFIGYLSYEQVATSMFEQEKVRVVDVEEGRYLDYVKVVVPKEDEDKITSKEYSINELKEYYNEEYDKDQYIDEKDSVELILDATTNYTITKDDKTE